MKKLSLIKFVLFFIFFALLSFSCESPYLVKHPVACGDVYYLYATYYADNYEGQGMANGSIFSNEKLTCAAKGFPFGTLLEVQSLDTRQRVEVTVTDRPRKNVVDLTKKAFSKIDNLERGKIRVRIKVIGLAAKKDAAKAVQSEKQESKMKSENSVQEVEKKVFFTIQLASYDSLDLAKKFQQNQAIETYIFTSDNKFRVRYGRYSTKDEAEAEKASKFSGSDATVVQVEE